MPVTCVLNFDHVALAQRERIVGILGQLPRTRWPAARQALLVACGFAETESPSN